MRATRGRSPGSFCGTCEMEHRYEQVLREAILHEYVGDYDVAVPGYFGVAWHDTPADHLRLLSLYDKAGQLPDLLRIVEEEDERDGEMIRKYRKGCENGGYCPSEHSGLFRTIHGILETRALEKAGDWQALLSILEPEHPGGGSSRPEHEVREAARLLALHPSE